MAATEIITKSAHMMLVTDELLKRQRPLIFTVATLTSFRLIYVCTALTKSFTLPYAPPFIGSCECLFVSLWACVCVTLWLSCVAPCKEAPVYLEQNSKRPGNTGLKQKQRDKRFKLWFSIMFQTHKKSNR